MLFIQHLRRGLSPEDAAQRVKKFLFDYDNLSPIERNFFRRVIPFYVWFRKNIPLQVEMMLKRPGRAATQFKVLGSRPEENDQLSLREVDGHVMRLNRDGKNITVLTGVDLPVTQLNYFDAILGNKRRQRELISMLNPIIRGFGIERPLNVNILTGRSLDRAESTMVGKFMDRKGFPQGIRDWLGYRKDRNPMTGKVRYTFDGKKFFTLFEMWAQSRMIRTGDRAFGEQILRHENPNLLQWFLTATRTETLNLDVENFRKTKQRRREIEEELIKRGFQRELPLAIDAPEASGF